MLYQFQNELINEYYKESIEKFMKDNNLEYHEEKDVYADIASQVFNLPYEECLEPQGHLRRNIIKGFCLDLFRKTFFRNKGN